jgi:hypothetical protein
MGQWLADNFFNIVTTVCGTGLWFTAFSIRKDAQARKEETKARKVANLLAITANHREIWKEYLNNPNLARVRDTTADLAQHPVTDREQVFVTLVILHTQSVYYAQTDRLVVEYEGMRQDIAQFFSLPIPNAVWSKTKLLQNQDFAAFIDSSLKKS